MADDIALGMPRDEAGAKQWRADNKKPRVKTDTQPNANSRGYWEARRAEIMFRKEVIELKQLEETLVDVGEVERFIMRQVIVDDAEAWTVANPEAPNAEASR